MITILIGLYLLIGVGISAYCWNMLRNSTIALSFGALVKIALLWPVTLIELVR